jgi:hypothetical protein
MSRSLFPPLNSAPASGEFGRDFRVLLNNYSGFIVKNWVYSTAMGPPGRDFVEKLEKAEDLQVFPATAAIRQSTVAQTHPILRVERFTFRPENPLQSRPAKKVSKSIDLSADTLFNARERPSPAKPRVPTFVSHLKGSCHVKDFESYGQPIL